MLKWGDAGAIAGKRLILLAVAAVSSTGLSNPGRAQDATWKNAPATGELSDGSNWVGGSRPTQDAGIGIFGASSITTLTTSALLRWEGIRLNADAGNYSLTNSYYLILRSAGIAVNGGSLSLTNTGDVEFVNSQLSGAVNLNNSGTMGFYGTSSAGNASITNSGMLKIYQDSTVANAALTNMAGGVVDISSNGAFGHKSLGSLAGAGDIYLGYGELTIGSLGRDTTFAGVLSDCGPGGSQCIDAAFAGGGLGSIVKVGTGTMTLTGINTYTGGTTFAGGTVSVSADTNLGGAAGGLTFNGGTLQITGTTFTSTARSITWGSNGGGFDIADPANNLTVSQAITGTGGLTKLGAGTLTLTGSNTYAGGTTVTAGLINFATGDNLGTGNITLNGGGLQWASGNTTDISGRLNAIGTNGAKFDTNGTDVAFANGLTGTGGLTKAGMGKLTLSGANTYTGDTIVNGGILTIAGTIASGAFVNNTTNFTTGIWFTNTSSAGNASITNHGFIYFKDDTSAANANIVTGGGLIFQANSTASNATITNTSDLYFTNNATAGNATITSTRFMYFRADSTAGSATITNGYTLDFSNAASAGNATIINNGDLSFYDSTTAGSATIKNTGNVYFSANSTAGTASLINQDANAAFDFSRSFGPNSDFRISAGSLAGNGTFNLGSNELTVGGNNLSTEVTGMIYGTGGSLVKTGTGTLTLSGVNYYTSGTTFAGGTVSVSSEANLGNIAGGLTFNGGILQITGTSFNATTRAITWSAGGGGFDIADAGNTFNLWQSITGAGGLTKLGAGTLLISGSGDYSGLTSVQAGTLQLDPSGSFSANSRHDIAAGATLDLNGGFATVGSLSGTGTVTTSSGPARLVTGLDNTAATFAGTIKDGATGAVEVWIGGFGSTGTAIFTGANTYTGGTVICDCATLQLGNGGTTGSIIGDVDNGGTLIFNRSNAYTFAGIISDSVGTGKVLQNGTGNTILTGQNTYTGETIVNAGTLSVNGSIAASSLTTVNPGATLGGTGTVGNTLINGGTLAPGNSIGTLTVAGNLVLTTAAIYLVEISGAASDRTIVTGNATLAGALVIRPDARLSATTTYTFLTAAGIGGAFDTTTVLGNFARNPRYSLIGGNLQLTLDPSWLSPVLPGAANTNQRNVAAAVDNALNGGNALPAGLNALFNLGGNDLLRALTQASGETGVGLQQTSLQAMNLFLGVMTDPGTAGRAGLAPMPGPSAFADEVLAYASPGSKRSASERDAFALMTKAAPRAPVFDPSWNVWAAGFGGSQTTDGNTALGSNTTTSRTYSFAVGADYLWAPQTVAGFALAGGGTTFSVANGGTGSSDLFQAGAYLRHTTGSAYLTAAAAYGWQDVTTDRSVTAAGFDRLRGRFHANAFSGRVELGNRFNEPWMNGVGLTPYAAMQITALDLPAYAESLVAGTGNFALAYDGKTITAPRTELGLRADKSFALDGALLTLRGRAAWAHDYQNDRTLQATFQSLPGASFVVNGAMAARDAALTSASAEVAWRSGFSLAATFEGEFSETTRSYAGKGVVRYTW